MSGTTLTASELAGYFDHTLLKADATKQQFEAQCQEARDFGFAMVAVNPWPVAQCSRLLADTAVNVGAAIAFPLGQNTIAQKVDETVAAIADGADEIDYVVNISELKDGNHGYIEEEMSSIVAACRERGALSKVILETCYLTDDEKRTVATIAKDVRPDFVKTSTGFGPAGATPGDVELLASIVDGQVQVKASGGVRSLDDALRYIDLGATRLGSSSSVRIVEEYSNGR
jgi:deoxyribose-phosphate aldolase